MAANDLPPWLLWPGPYQPNPAPYGTWIPAPAMGWSCPGCGHCYAPVVSTCMYCPAQATAPQESAIAPAPVLHPCPKPLEGGLCGCDEDGEQ